MESRLNDDFKPLHDRPSQLVHRYFEELMRLTYEYPELMSQLVKVVGISSLALMSAPWWSNGLSAGTSLVAIAIGATGAVATGASWFMQNKFYGYPIDDDQQVYEEVKFFWQSAKAKMILESHALPRIQIEAEKPYDAGYVEGYMLGEAIRHTLAMTNFLYTPMRLMGAPSSKSDMMNYLHAVYNKIPQRYHEEMQGKIAGYNDWLQKQDPNAEPLTLEYYLLLQLLPDIRNYNPFATKSRNDEAISDVVSSNIQPACTTIALRLGEYTFVTRVLDWPSYGDCGRYFLQVDRRIGDAVRTIDIGIPLLSGALTVLNGSGLMIEMNVAHGDKIEEPNGMPAVFFNRFCAENATCVSDIEMLIANESPLGAYHLTASDGNEVRSFHFYQHPHVRGEHAVDALVRDEVSPQVLVVANHGLEYKNSVAEVDNHRDSDQRKANIHYFFSNKQVQNSFTDFIKQQHAAMKMPAEKLQQMKEFCLQVARLPLVSNRDSVLCALYVYHHKALIEASVATDNLYAQKRDLSEFRSLKVI